MKKKPGSKGRKIGATQRKIQNLSRAINKIDNALLDTPLSATDYISDVKMGINDFTYSINGQSRKVRYDQIKDLSKREQANLLNKLNAERYDLRQVKALEDLGKKGKLSKQFKRVLEKDNKAISKSISEIEDILQGTETEAIKDIFGEVKTTDSWMNEFDEQFQEEGSDFLFEFYNVHGTKSGFSQLNRFTWESYKVMKGLMA